MVLARVRGGAGTTRVRGTVCLCLVRESSSL